MNTAKGLLLSAAIMVTTSSYAARPMEGTSLPVVPVSVTDSKRIIKRTLQTNIPTIQKPILVVVSPGVTELVEVAQNYYNRIVTPFANPKVISVNPLDFRKEGNVLFIQPKQQQPVGIYILPQDSSEDQRAISLALVPKKIPPRTIELSWGKSASTSFVNHRALSKKAEKWETSSNYEKTLLKVNALLAKGDMPPGYEIRSTNQAYQCAFAGLTVTVGQILEGSQFQVLVAKAVNNTRTGYMIVEESCYSEGVVAISTWPRTYLEPGEKTELYIVKKKTSRSSTTETRTRLVN